MLDKFKKIINSFLYVNNSYVEEETVEEFTGDRKFVLEDIYILKDRPSDLDMVIGSPIVRSLLLKLNYKTPNELFVRTPVRISREPVIVTLGEYFDDYSRGPYTLLDEMEVLIRNKRVTDRQLEDYITIVNTFKYYLDLEIRDGKSV